MPELPDVEIFRRYLNTHALNQKIARVVVKNTMVTPNTSPQAIARHLKNRKLQSSHRHGKFLFGILDRGGSVVFHFGMTGFLKYFKEKPDEPKHTRVRFEFSNRGLLGFVCPRMFGQVDYTDDVNQYIKKRRLGPDALAVTRREFTERLAEKKSSIKSALMDQRLLAGIGNIYSDEILFHARVHPKMKVDRLSAKQLGQIYQMTKNVLRNTIRYNADPQRVPRSWLLPHRHKNTDCPRCGNRLQRIMINQRSAYVCPKCQRRVN